jgi:hypothetical protein
MADVIAPNWRSILARVLAGPGQKSSLRVVISGLPASGRSPLLEPVVLGCTLTVADPGDFTYRWSVTRNGSSYAVGAAPTFDFTPDAPGRYTVGLQVIDSLGHTSYARSHVIVVEGGAPLDAPAEKGARHALRSPARLPIRIHRSWQMV